MLLYYSEHTEKLYLLEYKDSLVYDSYECYIDHYVMSKAEYIEEMYEDEDGEEREDSIHVRNIKPQELMYVVFQDGVDVSNVLYWLHRNGFITKNEAKTLEPILLQNQGAKLAL